MMISLTKEARILKLLEEQFLIREIASRVGVARSTVIAVRDNQGGRAATRSILARRKFIATKARTKFKTTKMYCSTCRAWVTTLPCVLCHVRNEIRNQSNNNWLKLNMLLGTEGEKFVRIVKDILNIDAMRVIHHPLFASLVRQSHDAIKFLPDSQKGKSSAQKKEDKKANQLDCHF